MLGTGLVGASRVATYAVIGPARDLPRVEVKAIASRDPARAKAYAATHGIPRCHDDYAALFAVKTVNLIYVGSPLAHHAEQAMATIAAGKGVLVEKPFAMNAIEARTVFASAQVAGVLVVEAMHSLHHAMFQRLHALIGGNAIGALERIKADFSVPIPDNDPIRWHAKLGGGALMDLGVYPLAWARAFGGEVFEVDRAIADMRRGIHRKP